MKAVRIEGDGSVSVVEMEVPAIGPGEALMRPGVAGICGSDLLDWYVAKKAGQILGHEVAGEIAAVGEDVTAFAAGDRIVPHHHAPCLACEEGRAGRYVHCAVWRSSRLDPGGMAEFVRIPAGNLARDTRKIPETMSFEEASFIEPLATVVKVFPRGGQGEMRAAPARHPRARPGEDPRDDVVRGGELHRAARDRRQGLPARATPGGAVSPRRGPRHGGARRPALRPRA